MMSGISNKKFLALFAMVAACMAASSFSTVNAAGVRRRRSSNERQQPQQQNNRSLKSSKSSKGGSSTTLPPDASIPPTSPPVVNPLSIKGFDLKCPTQAGALEGCLALHDGNQDVCKLCVIGLASLNSDITGLKSCSNINFNGGVCKQCEDETQNYYNCGADKSLGEIADSSSPTPTPTDPSAATFSKSGYALEEVCPDSKPVSGDSCDMQDYEYLRCPYSDGSIITICTCRHDQQLYLCNAYD